MGTPSFKLQFSRLLDRILKFIFGQRIKCLINFTDGSTMSLDEASYLLKAEGKIVSGCCNIYPDGVVIRDAVGVLEDHHPMWMLTNNGTYKTIICNSTRRISNQWFKGSLHTEANTQPKEVGYSNDEDSMKIRSEHIAQYVLNKKNVVF